MKRILILTLLLSSFGVFSQSIYGDIIREVQMRKHIKELNAEREQNRIRDSINLANQKIISDSMALLGLKRDSTLKAENLIVKKRNDSIAYIKYKKDSTTRSNEMYSPWVNLEMDSATFRYLYGSINQYHFQKECKRKSLSKCEVQLITMQVGYVYDLAYFIGLMNYNVRMVEDVKTVEIYATRKSYTVDSDSLAMKAIVYVSEQGTIQKIDIKGKADDLIDFYIKYMPSSDISINNIKRNGKIEKVSGTDRFYFSWFGIDPLIEIRDSGTGARFK